ncbi:unnamed protein product, partial [Rotaria sp. Silwood1]
ARPNVIDLQINLSDLVLSEFIDNQSRFFNFQTN